MLKLLKYQNKKFENKNKKPSMDGFFIISTFTKKL